MNNLLLKRFLLTYEAKRWSKAKFFYVNEIAIFRRSWHYHWFAPRQWKRQEITGFTPPYSNTSLSFFHWSQAGSTCGARHLVLSSFQSCGPVTYTLFSLQPPPCTELLFEFAAIKTFSTISRQLFFIAEGGLGVGPYPKVIRLSLPADSEVSGGL